VCLLKGTVVTYIIGGKTQTRIELRQKMPEKEKERETLLFARGLLFLYQRVPWRRWWG